MCQPIHIVDSRAHRFHPAHVFLDPNPGPRLARISATLRHGLRETMLQDHLPPTGNRLEPILGTFADGYLAFASIQAAKPPRYHRLPGATLVARPRFQRESLWL